MAVKVTLRRYDISKGRQSLFLQYYPPVRNSTTMKMMHKEMLGIYIYKKPKNEAESSHNKICLQTASAVEAQRKVSIMNDNFGFFDKERLKEDFLEYFAALTRKKDQKWERVFKHFYYFVKGVCTFEDVDVNLCRRFRDYLIEDARQLNDSTKRLMTNSSAGYFSTFRALLKIAYRDKRIKENVNDFLDKINYEDTKKEYLTIEEVKMLINTPCEIPALKSASIFACLTGLRISDVLQLEWRHIEKTNNDGYCLRIRTEKTNTEATLPLSEEALEWCGERSDGAVFDGLARYMVYAPLKKWVKLSGITKKITFHCFRHTFATLQIAMGTDIYTVSKMLTHKHVATTEIYAQLVNEKKVESANRLTFK